MCHKQCAGSLSSKNILDIKSITFFKLISQHISETVKTQLKRRKPYLTNQNIEMILVDQDKKWESQGRNLFPKPYTTNPITAHIF
jgi:hypothetical protein